MLFLTAMSLCRNGSYRRTGHSGCWSVCLDRVIVVVRVVVVQVISRYIKLVLFLVVVEKDTIYEGDLRPRTFFAGMLSPQGLFICSITLPLLGWSGSKLTGIVAGLRQLEREAISFAKSSGGRVMLRINSRFWSDLSWSQSWAMVNTWVRWLLLSCLQRSGMDNMDMLSVLHLVDAVCLSKV